MPIDSDVQIELNNIYNQLQVINSKIEVLDGRLTQLQTDFNTFVESVESVSERSAQSPTSEEIELFNQLANTANTL